jgi:hypothetical protein
MATTIDMLITSNVYIKTSKKKLWEEDEGSALLLRVPLDGIVKRNSN